jgi:hypothetical protein
VQEVIVAEEQVGTCPEALRRVNGPVQEDILDP